MAGDDSEQLLDAGPSDTNEGDPTDDTPDAAATREKLNQALIQVLHSVDRTEVQLPAFQFNSRRVLDSHNIWCAALCVCYIWLGIGCGSP